MTNHCWQTQETIRLNRPGLLAEMNVMERDGKRFLEIRWELQSGVSLQFAQPTAHIYMGGQGQPAEVAMQESLVGSAMELQPVAPLVGGYLPPPADSSLRSVWTYLALPETLPESFRVQIPGYSISGKADSLPEVRFKKTSTVQYFAPIQC